MQLFLQNGFNNKKKENMTNFTYNEEIDGSLYSEAKEWCLNNNARIESIGYNLFKISEIPAKTLDELKEIKIAELKVNRDSYKKTIIIKDNITLADLEVGTNNYENLIRLKYGWVQADLDLYDEKIEIIVNIFDTKKTLINNATIDNIQSISTNFTE
jgi:hypothetical protein